MQNISFKQLAISRIEHLLYDWAFRVAPLPAGSNRAYASAAGVSRGEIPCFVDASIHPVVHERNVEKRLWKNSIILPTRTLCPPTCRIPPLKRTDHSFLTSPILGRSNIACASSSERPPGAASVDQPKLQSENVAFSGCRPSADFSRVGGLTPFTEAIMGQMGRSCLSMA